MNILDTTGTEYPWIYSRTFNQYGEFEVDILSPFIKVEPGDIVKLLLGGDIYEKEVLRVIFCKDAPYIMQDRSAQNQSYYRLILQ